MVPAIGGVRVYKFRNWLMVGGGVVGFIDGFAFRLYNFECVSNGMKIS